MDEFVKDVAANNIGMLLLQYYNIIMITTYFRCKGDWI